MNASRMRLSRGDLTCCAKVIEFAAHGNFISACKGVAQLAQQLDNDLGVSNWKDNNRQLVGAATSTEPSNKEAAH